MDSPPKVLVVEDFEDLRRLVASYLDSRGYQVFEAANGKVAIQTARSEKPHLILLDIRLPDIKRSGCGQGIAQIVTDEARSHCWMERGV